MDDFNEWGVRYRDFYLYGFSPSGNPIWTIDFEEAIWTSTVKANGFVELLETRFGLKGSEVIKL